MLKSKIWRRCSVIFLISLILCGTIPVAATAQSPAIQASKPTAISPQAESGLVEKQIEYDTKSAVRYEILGATGPALYIVQMEDSPLASYRGELPGLKATSPAATGGGNLNISSKDSLAYGQHLASKRDSLLGRMETAFNRKIKVIYTYDVAYNGMTVELTPEEAAQVVTMPGVRQVTRNFERYIDTDYTPEFLNAVSIWDGAALPINEDGTTGEGVVVGIIDTGINMDHRSFAATGDDGYTHTNPRPEFCGWCNPAHPGYNASLPCNGKLIGVYSYPTSGDNPEDDESHGSHVASTAAGNVLYDVDYLGLTIDEISGMAPHANIIAYDVCVAGGGCDIAAILAGIDDATADDVDVINYSIGSSPNDPWDPINDPDALAFLAARDAGVFVATSAGNTGPGAGTVGSPGNAPWLTTVGNTTIGRVLTNTLDITGPGVVPGELTGIAAVQGEGGPPVSTDISAEIIYAGDVDPGNYLGCNAFPADAFAGSIALIQRGSCNFSVKVDNAASAGAIAVIVFNHSGGPPMVMGGLETTTIPAVFITLDDGIAVRDWVQAQVGPTARINAGTARVLDADWDDIMNSGSSRGPNVNTNWIKPDIAAPGTNIFAAYMGDPDNFGMMSGTSMASPHVAGAAALLRQYSPDWTPAEVQSALMMTSRYDTVLKENAATPADAFDQGAGRLDLTHAALTGLVLNETTANFEAANPALGGDPKTLNLASMSNHNCVGTCTWTRTVRSVLDGPADYTLFGEGPVGMGFTFTPSTFTILAGGTQEIQITVDVSTLPLDVPVFGRVLLETDALHPSERPVSDNHMPVVVVPRAGAPAIDVDPALISATQAPDVVVSHPLTINNTGTADLQWEIFTGETGVPGAPIEMIIDDGSVETNVGIGGTAQFIFLNRFTPAAGSFPITLNQIQVFFSSLVNIGDDMRLVVYENTSANSDPAVGSSFLASVDVTVSAVDAWNTYDLATPVTLNGPGDVLIGVIALKIPGTSYYPAALDQTATQQRSWAGWWTTAEAPTPPTLPADSYWGLIDSFFPGNWMIRGYGTGIGTPCDSPSPVAWLSLSPTTGTTAPGAGTSVNLSLDSTGLAIGTFEALLCVASNDPVSNQVLVPITLEVAESAIPNIMVDPLSLSSTQATDTITTQGLTIENTGDGDLTWTIAEKSTAASPPATPMGGDIAKAREVLSPEDFMADPPAGPPAPLTSWAMPQAVYHDNGLLVTHPGEGAGGADVSALQTALGLNTYGIGAQVSAGNRVADDFTIGGPGLAVTTITFFAYQTNSTTASTIDQVNLRIWDGPPNDPGSMVVFGDTTTNRLVSSTWTNIYRTLDTELTNTQRPIMTVVAEVNTLLSPGTYWVDWQINGTLASGPWVPPVTILGQTGKPGANALQYTSTGWGPAQDTGTLTAQDLPFIVDGIDDCTDLADVPWLSVAPSSGTTSAGNTSPVDVGLDSTGLAPDTYTANLCIFCNDPDPGPGNETNLVIVPVAMEVTEVPPAPAITLTKTVGTEMGVCATTNEITVPAGTTVYYCYTVTNTGNIDLNLHDLVDDQLGPIFSGLNYTLAPGASINTVNAGLSILAVINVDTTNTATWTAYNAGPTNQVTAQASATVFVEELPPPATVTVVVDPPEGGTVSGGGVYAVGDSVTVEAFPDPGWEFVHWLNDPNPPVTANPYTFTVNGDISLTAVFQRQEGVSIPTLSEWGIIVMLLLLSGMAVGMIRHHRIPQG